MDFGDMVGKAANYLSKKQAETILNWGKRLNEQERYVQRLERNIDKMNMEQKEEVRKLRSELEEKKHSMEEKGITVSYSGVVFFGDKSLEQWNSEWQCIGNLKSADLTPYNSCVGVYRHWYHGDIVYVGRANELYNGGFRKRLSDYRRESDSARGHKSGQLIHEHLDEIITDILVVGDTNEAVNITSLLEQQFIAKFDPPWNIQRY
jgi:flagellar biosynthesis GTPase FlhF